MTTKGTLNIQRLRASKQEFNWSEVSRPKLDFIRRYAGKKILDVGCSNGAYVKQLLALGYDAFGCDILRDDNWSKIEAKRFKKADVYRLPYPNQSFETVTLFETLEHIEHPALALKELSRVAIKNIILSVPNCELPQIFEKSGFTQWHYMDRTHVNFYTEKSIRILFKENGLTIKSLKLINPVMPETIFLHSWHIPLTVSVFIGKVIQRIPLSKKYYTDMVILASKTIRSHE